MIIVVLAVFTLVALLAAGFVVLPLLRRARVDAPPRKGLLLAAVAGLAVLLVGFGIYAVLGQPGMAVRALTRPDRTDYPGLIHALARGMRNRPDEVQGWVYLGQGYLATGQIGEAAKAYARAVALAKAQTGQAPPDLLANYAVALSLQSDGVPPEAEALFREALAGDPANQDARYHLGYAHAQRGELAAALRLWEPLALEASPDAPWRQALFAQIGALKARQPGTVAPGPGPGAGAQGPDIQAMVQRLADRLAASPDDLNGWLMLIRAYGVLGEREKGMAAWTQARQRFAGEPGAEQALREQARASGFE